jgi:DNA-binding transcriptional LysR family regulator
MDAFVRVIETGSFSSAARHLQVGQPSVSRAIAALEKRLGVRLLLRSTHSLSLTESGRAFYFHAKRSLAEAEEAEAAARGSAAALSGRIRVSAAVTFSRLHIIPHLGIFLAAHPDLNVEIMLDDRDVDLIDGGIDVAIRLGDLTDSAFTARKLGRCRRFVLATPAYFERVGEPKVPGDLAALEGVVYDVRGGGSAWQFSRSSEQISVYLRGRVRMNAAEGIRAAVLANLGFTIASEWMFSPELQTGEVKAVLLDWELPAIDLWAVFPTGRQVSARARAFSDFISERLDTAEALAEGKNG